MAREISLVDFAPLSGDDWYAPLKAAIAYLAVLGGGTLRVPKRTTPYACNVTVAIDITANDITIQLDAGAVLENTSTGGVDFFRFAGATGGRHRVNFRDGTIRSRASAGHVFTFAADVGLAFADWTSEIVQLNPAKSIVKGSAWTSSGMFSNRFGGPQWGHGSGGTPGAATCPTVPAVDIATTTNAFNANAFTMLRVNAHHGTAPFFSFLNNGISTAAFYSHNVVDVGTVEQVRSGFVKAHGALGLEVRAAFYDSKTIDGHVIETGTGSGGRNSEQCRIGPVDFVSVISGGDGVVGLVSDTPRTITNLTWSGATATAESTAHGFQSGQRVYVSGADQADYNGRFTVTVVDANTFTYPLQNSPATPATGTITAKSAAMTVKLGDGDFRQTILHVGGNKTAEVEVDLNNRSALVVGDHSKVLFVRAAAAMTTLIRGGDSGESAVETDTVLASTIAERSAGAGITLLGQDIKAILVGTAAVDLPSLGAGTSALVRVNATGVKTGDRLIFHPNSNGPGPGAPTSSVDLIVGLPWISADDHISFIVYNVSGGTANSSNRTWHWMVFRS